MCTRSRINSPSRLKRYSETSPWPLSMAPVSFRCGRYSCEPRYNSFGKPSRSAVHCPAFPRVMNSTERGKSRLAYIDWMRGLACVLMFQTHCYDSWLSPAARQSKLFMYSQIGGTFPAPLFLFLAGISFAFLTQKLRQ